MKTLAELADEIWAWQQATFGDAMTVQGALNKLTDEVEEVMHAQDDIIAQRPCWYSQIIPFEKARNEELADCFFMLVQAAGLQGYEFGPLGSLSRAMDQGEQWMPLHLGRFEAFAHTGRWRRAFQSWAHACRGDIRKAIEAKLAKNKARTWAKPAVDGTISHVKGVG